MYVYAMFTQVFGINLVSYQNPKCWIHLSIPHYKFNPKDTVKYAKQYMATWIIHMNIHNDVNMECLDSIIGGKR